MASWMPQTPAERVMWLALLILVAGFLGGQYLNRARSKRVGKWIQAGIGGLGGRVAWRFSKSLAAGAEVSVEEARAPYRNLTISYYLLTREFPPLWLWELFRSKRDLVSVRANLRLMPTREFEIVPSGGALRKKLDEAVSTGESVGQPFEWLELSNGLGLGMRGAVSDSTCQKAKDFLNTYAPYVERVSLRKRSPNVIAFFRLGSIETQPSAKLWQALGDLVKG